MLDVDRSTMIVKKLKLTGVPYNIFKNTAFIKDMLSGALEVASGIWKPFRNQMVHLELRLKIKYYSKAVSRFSLTDLEEKNT